MWRVARPIAHYTEFNKNERWSRMSDTRLKYKERRKQENKGIIQGEQGDGVSWSRTEQSPRALSPRPSWSSISLRATKHSNILKPVRLWTTTTTKKKSLLHYLTVSKPKKISAWLSWQQGWHTTVKVPNDEWLLKPACAYVSLFGPAISSNEDNNIARWHGLSVLFCLSVSWHHADRRPLCYAMTRLTFYYISLSAF